MPNKLAVRRNNSLGDGVVAFGQWVCNMDVLTLPITLRQFSSSGVILCDRALLADVTVEIADGIPRCLYCTSGDCIHVGFAVCASRMRNTLVKSGSDLS